MEGKLDCSYNELPEPQDTQKCTANDDNVASFAEDQSTSVEKEECEPNKEEMPSTENSSPDSQNTSQKKRKKLGFWITTIAAIILLATALTPYVTSIYAGNAVKKSILALDMETALEQYTAMSSLQKNITEAAVRKCFETEVLSKTMEELTTVYDKAVMLAEELGIEEASEVRSCLEYAVIQTAINNCDFEKASVYYNAMLKKGIAFYKDDLPQLFAAAVQSLDNEEILSGFDDIVVFGDCLRKKVVPEYADKLTALLDFCQILNTMSNSDYSVAAKMYKGRNEVGVELYRQRTIEMFSIVLGKEEKSLAMNDEMQERLLSYCEFSNSLTITNSDCVKVGFIDYALFICK